ncbi:MAG: adenylate/guanylate cyclase domain-containing protein [Treponema sp.]|jgi:adenylate/guanylate cyclase catalytic domain protein|uniref:adenylate/guanylate cyclase domain-containing protein n=1 Tax=unclassified Treponema TaxID=2638727 RepID=UPI00220F9EFA|nr:adenylate/guanylate cyclase domain-containing protein [Treponema sp. OMZ 906]
MRVIEDEKLETVHKQTVEFPYKMQIVSLVIFVALIFLPFGMDKMDLVNHTRTPQLLYPFTVLFSGLVQQNFLFFYVSCFSFFLLPVAFLIIFISIFNKRITQNIVIISAFVAVTCYLAAAISGMTVFANTIRWFQSLSILVYMAFFLALTFHIFLISYGIALIKARNETYSAYKQLILESEKTEESDKQPENKKKFNIKRQVQELIGRIKSPQKKTHLKSKIAGVILIAIIIIISVFIYTDLKNYKLLLTQNVNTTGKNQAEQVAAIYGFSDGLHAKISAFLEGIKKTNASSPFPHRRVDIITTDSKEPVFLDKIDNTTVLPDFNVFSYTTEQGAVRNIPAEEKRITAEEAALYIKHFQNINTRSQPIYKADKRMCLYVHPITFSRKDGQRLVGFSVVTYMKEILDRPYFQAKVFIFALAAIFLYAAIIITLFLADFIAEPIIQLCVNIRKTTNILNEIFSGNAKIDAHKLVFDDNLKTRDEIKTLSKEIKNIITLVRGMLPYISFHTLRNAEKDVGSKSISRNLCFLFTDIRGFTKLCEKLPAREVILMLNRYLNIETKIIFDNGGDVDKYVGDEMMAFFAGPKKEINACKAAMEIREALYREQLAALKVGRETISLGIGINTGYVIFGPVGSETRKDFTSIGDTVNLAARLEGANKQYGSKTIISEAVYNNLGNAFICRELDYITVKGKTEVVRIFEVLQEAKKNTGDKIYDLKKLFETGLDYYRQRKWKTAEKYFLECVEKYNDKPAKVFLERIEHYRSSPPPADWKGVFVMRVK